MKKLLLSLFTTAAFGSAYSQCIPDTAQVNNLPPGQTVPIYPVPGTAPGGGDTLSTFAALGFSDMFSLKVPNTVLGAVTVDSVQLTAIENLPSSVTYACNTPNCVFQDNTYGCVKFSGTVATGSYVNIALKITLNGTTDVSAFFKPTFWLVAGPLGVEILDVSKFALLQNTPNPVSDKTTINFTAPNPAIVQFNVLNTIGQIVHTSYINSKQGVNDIDFDASNLSNGTYFYNLSNGDKTLTGKMTISKQ